MFALAIRAARQIRTLSDVAAQALTTQYQQIVKIRDADVWKSRNVAFKEQNAPEDVSAFSGVPKHLFAERVARISIPTRNVMQSGVDTLQSWQISFDTRERWENPLMGWASS